MSTITEGVIAAIYKPGIDIMCFGNAPASGGACEEYDEKCGFPYFDGRRHDGSDYVGTPRPWVEIISWKEFYAKDLDDIVHRVERHLRLDERILSEVVHQAYDDDKANPVTYPTARSCKK